MVKPEVLRRRLENIDEYISYLKELSSESSEDFISDPKLFGSAERFLQLIIEMLNDMGSHLISDENLGSVNQARDIPRILLDKKIITAEQAANWIKMNGFRNLLVHEYLAISRKQVHKILKENLFDIIDLTKVFVRYL